MLAYHTGSQCQEKHAFRHFRYGRIENGYAVVLDINQEKIPMQKGYTVKVHRAERVWLKAHPLLRQL
ncbi:hypothetical protein NH00_25945 [Enterobacter cancerogenus]|jgi:hypothetical protein|nr:hypothetical protein NH00_25945 [Enterobacter cancerogenus]